MDLRILWDCKKSGVITKFSRFKLANRRFKNSYVYKKYQIRLPEEEIKSKQSAIAEIPAAKEISYRLNLENRIT